MGNNQIKGGVKEKAPSTECTICGFETSSMKALKSHMEDHNKSQVNVDEVEVYDVDDKFFEEINDVDIDMYDPTATNPKTINDEIIDEELEDEYDEDEEDEDDMDEENEPEVYTLDDGPEEITLDEDVEQAEEEVCVVDPNIVDKQKIEQYKMYDKILSDSSELVNFIEDHNKIEQLQNSPLAWYSRPDGWKPTVAGELWNGTAKQIASYFKLQDIALQLSPIEKAEFHNQKVFLNWIFPQLQQRNPSKPTSTLYRLAKAKWFQLLEPQIPVETATLDDDDYDDEEEDEDDDNYDSE